VSLLKKLWIAFFFLAGLIWLGNGAYDDEKMAENRYCSMLSLYTITNGKSGWPPFNPEIQCKQQQ